MNYTLFFLSSRVAKFMVLKKISVTVWQTERAVNLIPRGFFDGMDHHTE